MQIRLYKNFSKRLKSTKIPTSDVYVDVTANLKSETSIYKPTFELMTVDPGDITYVGAFGHYYFVSDITRVNYNNYELTCTEDPLASHRAEIVGYSAFVERAASAYNIALADPFLSPTENIVYYDISTSIIPGINVAHNNVVMRIVGKSGLKNFVTTLSGVDSVFQSAYDFASLNFSTVEDCLNALFVAIANPGAYVHKVTWFPFDTASGSSEIPYFGYLPGSTAIPIAKDEVGIACQITTPAGCYGDWRDHSRAFTTLSLQIPSFGVYDIDPVHVNSTLYLTLECDINSGMCELNVIDNNSRTIVHAEKMIGCDVPVGGLSGTGGLTSISSSIASAVVGGGMSSLVSGSIDAVTKQLTPAQNVMAANGNRAAWGNTVTATVVVRGSTSYPTSQSGRPLYEFRTLSNLSGYVKCQNASVPIIGTDTEREEINAALNNGFYLE